MSDHLFIHSDLDDAGLSPAEFRVLAHLSRRAGKDGICHPGIRSIAETCGVSVNSARKAIEALEEKRFIVTAKRIKALTEYSLTIKEGIAATVPKEGTPTVSATDTVKKETVSAADTDEKASVSKSDSICVRIEPHLCHQVTHKVIQEDNPIKVIQCAKRKRFDAGAVPLPFSSPQFASAWNEWCKHRTELRKALTPTSTTRQLATLATYGETRAIAAIGHSIENGWRRIFEPKAGKPEERDYSRVKKGDPRIISTGGRP